MVYELIFTAWRYCYAEQFFGVIVTFFFNFFTFYVIPVEAVSQASNQPTHESSSAPDDASATDSANETRSSVMHIEPTNITPPIDRSSEMNIQANTDNPSNQTSELHVSNPPPESTQEITPGNAEMQVESSGVSGTPSLIARLPQVAGIISAAVTEAAGVFVTPNLDVPIQECPGAPTRALPETPDASDPDLAPTPKITW